MNTREGEMRWWHYAFSYGIAIPFGVFLFLCATIGGGIVIFLISRLTRQDKWDDLRFATRNSHLR